jgi:hypothetical protein
MNKSRNVGTNPMLMKKQRIPKAVLGIPWGKK